MTTAFSRTLGTLDDRSRLRWLLPSCRLGLLLAWLAWFGYAPITLYEVTEQARLEVHSAASPVAAEVAGRVEETLLAIGRVVQQGEVLVVLDAQAERLALAERRARQHGLATQLQALQREIEAEQAALPVQEKARVATLAEAEAAVVQAKAKAVFAEQLWQRALKLGSSRGVSVEEIERARADVEAGRAAVRGLELAAERLHQDRQVQERERAVRLAKLQVAVSGLSSDQASVTAAIVRLEHDLSRRTLRAPISGRIGDCLAIRPGTVIAPGLKLATIVPPGRVRAVADFPAAVAARVQSGQLARLRLDGFPATVYGTLPAQVVEVGREPNAGRIRVELDLLSDLPTLLPAEHGLPGSAEVAVEQTTPARLVLRAAGQWLTVKPHAATVASGVKP
jgi:multidrug resistance efflux pump